ncbi:hypothetical protein LCGC14_2446880, partial [marine sediment metagenome]
INGSDISAKHLNASTMNITGRTIFASLVSNVGIGTLNPVYMLSIANGSVTAGLRGSLNVSDVLFVSDAGVGIGEPNPSVSLVVNGKVVVNGNIDVSNILKAGSIGIGTAIPNVNLHIASANANSILKLEQSGNGITSGVAFTRERFSGTGVQGACVGLDSDTATNEAMLVFDVDSNVACGQAFGAQQRFSINSSSGGIASFRNLNVGIGTDKPLSLLHVFGGVSAFGDGTNNAQLSSTGDLTLQGSADYLVDSNDYSFRAEADEDAGIFFDGTGIEIEMLGLNAESVFVVEIADLQVGINNYEPNATLEVSGTGNFTGDLQVQGELRGYEILSIVGDAISGNSGCTALNTMSADDRIWTCIDCLTDAGADTTCASTTGGRACFCRGT